MKQPDRLVRDATRLYDAAWNGRIDQHDCLQVMRRQYAALRRLVVGMKRYRMGSYIMLDAGDTGEWISISELLTAMDRWKKGTK